MKTFKLKTAYLAAAFFLLSFSAFSQQVSEIREVNEFSSIDAGSIFKIEYTQQDNYSLEIITEQDFLEKIQTKVSGGILEIDMKGSAKNTEVKVKITSPTLTGIDLRGASSFQSIGSVTADEFNIDLSGATNASLSIETGNLSSEISGASNLQITGKATEHTSELSGAGQLRAADLETQTTRISTSGAAYARVWAADNLVADASGTSKVSFDNQPANQSFNASGMGNINGYTKDDLNTSMQYKFDENGDTTRIKLGNRDLIIVDDNEISVTDNKKKKSFRDNWSGFELGINGYLNPDNTLTMEGDAEYIDLRYEKSVAVNLNLFQQSFPIISNRLGLVTGLGLGWNNYRFDNQTIIVYDKEGLDFYEDTINNIRKNKLTLTYLNIPLMLEFQTGGSRDIEKFHIAGGMIMGTRLRTHAKYVYDDDGEKRKEKDFKDFNVQPFRFDATARIGWGKINLFATYALNTLFKEDKGPELYPFTVGIRLVDF